MATALEARFEQYVDRASSASGCWLWTGRTAGDGGRYGGFRVGTRSTDPERYAHRVAYELWVGPIPEGLVLDHVRARGCTSTLCVNPAHLEPVTQAENQHRIRLRVCRSGRHDLTDDANVRWDSQGRRRGCARCHEEARRARAKG